MWADQDKSEDICTPKYNFDTSDFHNSRGCMCANEEWGQAGTTYFMNLFMPHSIMVSVSLVFHVACCYKCITTKSYEQKYQNSVKINYRLYTTRKNEYFDPFLVTSISYFSTSLDSFISKAFFYDIY